MNEARRFLRYLIPGFSIFFEFILYVLITSPKDLIVKNVGSMWSMSSGLPVVLAFISIGVGYLCANIFHNLYWHILPNRLREDHLLYLRQALSKNNVSKKKMLKIVDSENGNEIIFNQLTQLDGWNITTAFWHERTESSKIIKGANLRIDSLTDLKHGFGASMVGSFLAVILWVAACVYFPNQNIYSLPISIPILVMTLAFMILFTPKLISYERVIRNIEKIVGTIILDQLQKEYIENDKEVITIHYPLSETNKT